MLINLWTQKIHISLLVCATQMNFVLIFGNIECLLLTVMTYDRYESICSPLHYPLVMNHKAHVQLVAACWVTRVPIEVGQTCQIFSLSFCRFNQINHYFCGIPPVLKLACGDNILNEMLVFTVSVLFVMVPVLLILGSYSRFLHHPEVAIGNRKSKGFLHLLISCHGCDFITWICNRYIFTT